MEVWVGVEDIQKEELRADKAGTAGSSTNFFLLFAVVSLQGEIVDEGLQEVFVTGKEF